MDHDKESAKSQIVQLFRTAKPAHPGPRLPQITIRGDNNLINFGERGSLSVNEAGPADCGSAQPRNGQWPQQLLDAIRVKAIEREHSNDDLCEIASRSLGRAVVTLEKLSARELARVYETLCASKRRV